eukprot:GSMAST32.ASY1.ANO1.60.1 assembled CDS
MVRSVVNAQAAGIVESRTTSNGNIVKDKGDKIEGNIDLKQGGWKDETISALIRQMSYVVPVRPLVARGVDRRLLILQRLHAEVAEEMLPSETWSKTKKKHTLPYDSVSGSELWLLDGLRLIRPNLLQLTPESMANVLASPLSLRTWRDPRSQDIAFRKAVTNLLFLAWNPYRFSISDIGGERMFHKLKKKKRTIMREASTNSINVLRCLFVLLASAAARAVSAHNRATEEAKQNYLSKINSNPAYTSPKNRKNDEDNHSGKTFKLPLSDDGSDPPHPCCNLIRWLADNLFSRCSIELGAKECKIERLDRSPILELLPIVCDTLSLMCGNGWRWLAISLLPRVVAVTRTLNQLAVKHPGVQHVESVLALKESKRRVRLLSSSSSTGISKNSNALYCWAYFCADNRQLPLPPSSRDWHVLPIDCDAEIEAAWQERQSAEEKNSERLENSKISLTSSLGGYINFRTPISGEFRVVYFNEKFASFGEYKNGRELRRFTGKTALELIAIREVEVGGDIHQDILTNQNSDSKGKESSSALNSVLPKVFRILISLATLGGRQAAGLICGQPETDEEEKLAPWLRSPLFSNGMISCPPPEKKFSHSRLTPLPRSKGRDTPPPPIPSLVGKSSFSRRIISPTNASEKSRFPRPFLFSLANIKDVNYTGNSNHDWEIIQKWLMSYQVLTAREKFLIKKGRYNNFPQCERPFFAALLWHCGQSLCDEVEVSVTSMRHKIPPMYPLSSESTKQNVDASPTRIPSENLQLLWNTVMKLRKHLTSMKQKSLKQKETSVTSDNVQIRPTLFRQVSDEEIATGTALTFDMQCDLYANRAMFLLEVCPVITDIKNNKKNSVDVSHYTPIVPSVIFPNPKQTRNQFKSSAPTKLHAPLPIFTGKLNNKNVSQLDSNWRALSPPSRMPLTIRWHYEVSQKSWGILITVLRARSKFLSTVKRMRLLKKQPFKECSDLNKSNYFPPSGLLNVLGDILIYTKEGFKLGASPRHLRYIIGPNGIRRNRADSRAAGLRGMLQLLRCLSSSAAKQIALLRLRPALMGDVSWVQRIAKEKPVIRNGPVTVAEEKNTELDLREEKVKSVLDIDIPSVTIREMELPGKYHEYQNTPLFIGPGKDSNLSVKSFSSLPPAADSSRVRHYPLKALSGCGKNCRHDVRNAFVELYTHLACAMRKAYEEKDAALGEWICWTWALDFAAEDSEFLLRIGIVPLLEAMADAEAEKPSKMAVKINYSGVAMFHQEWKPWPVEIVRQTIMVGNLSKRELVQHMRAVPSPMQWEKTVDENSVDLWWKSRPTLLHGSIATAAEIHSIEFLVLAYTSLLQTFEDRQNDIFSSGALTVEEIQEESRARKSAIEYEKRAQKIARKVEKKKEAKCNEQNDTLGLSISTAERFRRCANPLLQLLLVMTTGGRKRDFVSTMPTHKDSFDVSLEGIKYNNSTGVYLANTTNFEVEYSGNIEDSSFCFSLEFERVLFRAIFFQLRSAMRILSPEKHKSNDASNVSEQNTVDDTDSNLVREAEESVFKILRQLLSIADTKGCRLHLGRRILLSQLFKLSLGRFLSESHDTINVSIRIRRLSIKLLTHSLPGLKPREVLASFQEAFPKCKSDVIDVVKCVTVIDEETAAKVVVRYILFALGTALIPPGLSVAAGKIDSLYEKHQSKERHAILNPPKKLLPPVNPESVTIVAAVGFDCETARLALRVCGGNAQQAVEWLLANPIDSKIFNDASKKFPIENDETDSELNTETSFNQDLQTMNNCDSEVSETNQNVTKNEILSEMDIIGNGASCRAASNVLIHLLRIFFKTNVKDVSTSVTIWATAIESELSKSLRDFISEGITADMRKLSSSIADQADGPYEQKSGTFLSDENTRIETATNKLEDMRNKISLAIASLAVMSTGWETLCVGCRVIVAGGSAGTVLSIQENVLAPMESSVSVLFDNTRVANTMLASKVTPVQEISTPMESLENLSELIINVSSVVLETESACNCNSEDDDTNLNHDESMNFLDKFYAMKHIRSVASLQLAMLRAFSMRALHTVLQTSNGLAIARGCNIIPLLIAEASTASSEPNLNTIQTLEYRNTEVWARILDMTYGNILPIDPPVSRVINDRCLEGKSQDAMNKRRAVASTLMAFAPVQNIELCIKALELKQDNVEMAADWLLTSGVSFLNAGGLDTDRSSQQYDSRFEAGKELAMMFGLPFNLCIKALRLMRDNKEAAADWLLSNGYSFQTGEEKPRAEILPFYFPPRINVENEETPLSESFNSGTESDVEECNASRNDGDSKPNITVSTSSQHKTSSKSFFSIDDMVCTNSFYDFMISVFDSKTSASFENEDIIWDRSRDIEYYYGKVSEIHDEDDGTKSYSIYCEIDGVERRFTRCNLRVLDEATFVHISKYEALIEDPFNIALRRQDERTRIKRNASASDSFEKHQGIDDSTLSELLGEHTLREDETRALIREMDLQQSNIILRNDPDNGFPSIAGTQTPLIGCQNYDGEASNNAQLLENDESKVDENNYNLQNFTEDMEFHPVLIPNPGESIQSKINMESVYKDKKTPIPISCVLPGIVVAVPFTSFAENVNPVIYKNDLRWVFAVVVKRPDVVYDMSESTIRICHFDIETSRRSMAEVSLSKIRFIVRLFGKSVSNGTKLLQRCISIEAALSISYSRLCLSRIIVGVKDSIDTTCELDAKHNMNITHGSKAEKYQNLAVKLIDAAKLMSENQEKKEKTKQKYDSSNWIEQLIILVKVFVASQKEFSCESNDTSICRMFQRMSIVGGGDSIGSSTLENQSHTIGSNFNSSCRSCPGRLLPDPSMVMYEFRQVLQTMVATEAFSNNDTSGMKLLLNALLKEATLSLRTSTTPGSVSQKNLLRLTSSSIHPYWPHSDESGEIELDTPGAHWIIFDSRCETLPTATLEFYRDKEHCLLTGVASGPKPWRPVVVTLPTSTVYWKFRARDQPPGQIDNPITGPWGWRFQIRPLKGQRWNSETAALSAPCLEWACWLLELLFRETSTGHKSQVFDALVAYLQARGAPGKQRVTKLLTRLVRSDWCVGDVPNLKLLQPIERSIMSWCMSEQKQGRVFLPQTVQELVGLILAAKEAARHLGLQDNNNDKTKRNRKDIDAKVDKSSESSMKMCSTSSKTKDDNTDSDSEELAGHPRIPGPEDLSGTLLVVSDMCDFLLSDPSYVKANTTNPDSSCVLPVCVLARALQLYSRLPSMEIRLKEAAKAMSIWTSRMDEELMSLVTQRSVSFEASAISIDRRWGNSERKIPSIFDLQPGCMSRLTEKEKNRFQLLANFPLDQFAEDQGNITEAPYVIRLRFAILRLWNGFVNRVLPLVDLMSIEDTNIEKTFNIRNIPNTTIDSTANEINPSMPLGLKLSRLKSKIFLASKMNMLNTAVYKTRGQIDSFTMSLNNQEAFQSREQSRNDLSARQVETSKCLFAQAVDALASASASSLRGGLKDAQLFKVKFSGEDGVDAGGLYRDTLTAFITDDLFSESSDAPPLLLFIKSPNGRNTEGNFRNCFVPNPQQKSPQSLSAFVVVGRLMGIALRTQHYLPFLLPPPFWTALTGKCNSVALSSFDFITAQLLQDIYESKPMTEEEFLEIYKDVPYMQNFTINGVWGKSCIRLVSDILSIPVQQSQKLKYVQLALIARLSEFNVQIDAIRRGLFELVPERSIRLLSGEQLQILVCGNTTVDIRVLKKHTLYEGWRGKSNNIFVKRFWRAIEKLNQSERSQFIRFVWGRSRLPRESDWGRPFKLTRRGGGDSTLPVAHTCFFQCEFPEYSSDEKCAAAIQVVIHYGFCGFHIS